MVSFWQKLVFHLGTCELDIATINGENLPFLFWSCPSVWSIWRLVGSDLVEFLRKYSCFSKMCFYALVRHTVVCSWIHLVSKICALTKMLMILRIDFWLKFGFKKFCLGDVFSTSCGHFCTFKIALHICSGYFIFNISSITSFNPDSPIF